MPFKVISLDLDHASVTSCKSVSLSLNVLLISLFYISKNTPVLILQMFWDPPPPSLLYNVQDDIHCRHIEIWKNDFSQRELNKHNPLPGPPSNDKHKGTFVAACANPE